MVTSTFTGCPAGSLSPRYRKREQEKIFAMNKETGGLLSAIPSGRSTFGQFRLSVAAVCLGLSTNSSTGTNFFFTLDLTRVLVELQSLLPQCFRPPPSPNLWNGSSPRTGRPASLTPRVTQPSVVQAWCFSWSMLSSMVLCPFPRTGFALTPDFFSFNRPKADSTAHSHPWPRQLNTERTH